MESSPATDDRSSGLIAFMKRPESWPDPPGRIEHVQTHASHLFIGTSKVYKIKKAVDYGFLDYSTLEKRRRYCHREVELNRRLTEGVYLGVVPIWRTGDGTWAFGRLENLPGDSGKENLSADQSPPGDRSGEKPNLESHAGEEYAPEHRSAGESEGEGEIVEYAVAMNRLAGGHFLLDYLRSGRLTEEHLEQVARKLTRFYRSREPDREVLEYGLPQNIWFSTEENFRQTEPFAGMTISRPAFRAIRHYANHFLKVNRDRFHRRIEQRRIVEGHGDLHLEHIHWSGGAVQIYDCIEFNERFRYIDVAADIAFLAMDLDFHKSRRLERYFVTRMRELLEDEGLEEMLDFYKCYRAWVRGKVNSLQSREGEVPEPERKEAAEIARRYFDLALSCALTGSQPVVLAVMGPIASGKSTLARQLSDALDIPVFSSDRIRKEMADLPLYERTPDARRSEIYSTEMSAKTYGVLAERAAEQVNSGSSVILDATFGDPLRRRRLLDRLEKVEGNCLFVEAHASGAVLRQRLEERGGKPSVISDARAEDYEALSRLYRPPDEVGWAHLVRVDTEKKQEVVMEQLFLELATRNAERPG